MVRVAKVEGLQQRPLSCSLVDMSISTTRDAVGANSICPAAVGTLGLMFSRPQVLSQEVANVLTLQGRFQEITLDDLARKGTTHFAWIRPNEFSQSVFCPDGAFAYKFADGPPKFFAVVSKPVFTRELLAEELENGIVGGCARCRAAALPRKPAHI